MRLSSILSFYIGRNFLWALLASLLAISGLILLFDLIELLRRTAENELVSFLSALIMALCKLPQMTGLILPFTILIGAMLTFWKMTRTRELVVARMAGVSVWQFLLPVIAVSLFIGIFNTTVFNPMAASLYNRYERMQEEFGMRGGTSLSVGKDGLWLRETYENEKIVLFARFVQQTEQGLKLSGINLYYLDANGTFKQRIDAEDGVLGHQQLEMHNGWVMQPGRNAESFAARPQATRLTVERIKENFSRPESLSFWQLPQYIEFFQKAGFSAHRHSLYWMSLLALPFSLISMVLVAAVFALQPDMRGGGLLRRIGLGCLCGFLYYFFSRLVYSLGLSQTLPPFLAAWSPTVIMGLIGLSLLLHQEDG